jgi:Nucleotidyltransferase of unknown function (DUF6036)
MPSRIQEPWLSFLQDVDRNLTELVELHCLGGFVLSVLAKLPRPTGDVDFIEVKPSPAGERLLTIAGEGTPLATEHSLHFHRVTIAEYPADYETRLIDITPRSLRNLRMMALEVHDVVLAKLSRNSPSDRADVEFLANGGIIDGRVLKKRFDAELRPYLLNEAREALTLDLWLDEYLGGRER